MSTDTVNHLTRKAAGKIKIINCNNMQGRCSAEQAVSASSDAPLTAEKTQFQPLTLEVKTEAVGLWGFAVFVVARSYFKKKNTAGSGKDTGECGTLYFGRQDKIWNLSWRPLKERQPDNWLEFVHYSLTFIDNGLIVCVITEFTGFFSVKRVEVLIWATLQEHPGCSVQTDAAFGHKNLT